MACARAGTESMGHGHGHDAALQFAAVGSVLYETVDRRAAPTEVPGLPVTIAASCRPFLFRFTLPGTPEVLNEAEGVSSH